MAISYEGLNAVTLQAIMPILVDNTFLSGSPYRLWKEVQDRRRPGREWREIYAEINELEKGKS